eukprot:14424837-Alexandrium_andersonii.AAC.1
MCASIGLEHAHDALPHCHIANAFASSIVDGDCGRFPTWRKVCREAKGKRKGTEKRKGSM